MDLLQELGTSSGLSLASGVNAYFPLLIVAILANPRVHLLQQFSSNRDLAFLSQDWVLALLAVLTILDFLSDKVPGVSGLWNTVHTVIRPVMGALASGSTVPAGHSTSLVVFLALGASLAAASHVTKLSTRTMASAATMGCATPVLSVMEDIGVVVGVIVALLAPLLMLFISLILIVLFIRFAPGLLREFAYYWRISWSFCSWLLNVRIRGRSDARPADVSMKLAAEDRARLYQIVPGNAVIRAGVQLLWIQRRGGKIRGKRRIVLPSWLLVTDGALILFSSSQPNQTQIIPFAEVQALKLKKTVSQGTLTIHMRAGQEYTCTILRTALSATAEMTHILHAHYQLPPDKNVQGTQIYTYPVMGHF